MYTSLKFNKKRVIAEYFKIQVNFHFMKFLFVNRIILVVDTSSCLDISYLILHHMGKRSALNSASLVNHLRGKHFLLYTHEKLLLLYKMTNSFRNGTLTLKHIAYTINNTER